MVREHVANSQPDRTRPSHAGEAGSSTAAPIIPPADTATGMRLAVIVPCYGNWDDTLDCLQLLGEQSSTEFRVILADDGSPQPPPREVTSFPFVTYVRYPHAGFAAVCNAAASAADAAGFTHLLLLNNDTAFGRDFILGWQRKVRELPQSILGPVIHAYDHPATVWYSGGRRSIAVPFMRLRSRFIRQSPVDVLTACALVIPMEVWRRLNGFESRFVTYYEDFDFVLRAREDGVAAYVVVEPELRVLHKGSRSTLQNGAWHREYRMLASRLLFIRRRYGGVRRVLCLLLVIPHLAMMTARNLPKLPSPRLLWKAIREGMEGTP